MITKADETARLLNNTFEVGDRVWWGERGEYYGDEGVVVRVLDDAVFVLWDKSVSAVGKFGRGPASFDLGRAKWLRHAVISK